MMDLMTSQATRCRTTCAVPMHGRHNEGHYIPVLMAADSHDFRPALAIPAMVAIASLQPQPFRTTYIPHFLSQPSTHPIVKKLADLKWEAQFVAQHDLMICVHVCIGEYIVCTVCMVACCQCGFVRKTAEHPRPIIWLHLKVRNPINIFLMTRWGVGINPHRHHKGIRTRTRNHVSSIRARSSWTGQLPRRKLLTL
jgi:hypothetical protein